MKDGLYIVDRGNIYGAFVVTGGKIVCCAPVLRRNLGFYITVARFVPTEKPSPRPVLVTHPDDDDLDPPPWRSGSE